MGNSITEWQRRLAEQPQIWFVMERDECTGNYYASREAAELELNWLLGHGSRRVRVVGRSIHSLGLSQERWLRTRPQPDTKERP